MPTAEGRKVIAPIKDTDWTPETEQLLEDWHRRVYAAQSAYYVMAERLRRRHYWLGVPTVILSSVVGTTMFAQLGDTHVSTTVRVLAGAVSIGAAVLAGLQTFLKPSQAATEHGFAADWFAAIRRDIEELIALPSSQRGAPKACLDAVRKEIAKAGQKAPELDESLWGPSAERFGVKEPPVPHTTDGRRAV
jgi:hypothetical protein